MTESKQKQDHIKQQSNFMAHLHIINPYQSISEDDKVFEFGMTLEQVSNIDSKIFEIKKDNKNNWVLERRGGYSTEFINGKLVAVAFRIDPGYHNYQVEGIDFSGIKEIEELQSKYEHYVFSNGESILFPSLGFLVSVTPFCDGWENPRPGVFNREIIAFSKERLHYYRHQSQIINLLPQKGVSLAGSELIEFGMLPKAVCHILGEPEYSWKNFGSHKHIIDYYFNRGIRLKYRDYSVSYKYSNDMPLYTIEILENNRWQVEIDGIYLFKDDKLASMKSKYEYIESKKKKAVAFPSLGIFTLGCGDKKNGGKGAEGKVIYLCRHDVLNSFIRHIDLWD